MMNVSLKDVAAKVGVAFPTVNAGNTLYCFAPMELLSTHFREPPCLLSAYWRDQEQFLFSLSEQEASTPQQCLFPYLRHRS